MNGIPLRSDFPAPLPLRLEAWFNLPPAGGCDLPPAGVCDVGPLLPASEVRFARLEPPLPNPPRGVPRGEDRGVVFGIVPGVRSGLTGRDGPAVCGPSKTRWNRVIRESPIGAFDRVFATLAGEGAATDAVRIDATPLKVHRAASLLEKGFRLELDPRGRVLVRLRSPPDRARQRRPDLQTAPGLRRRGPSRGSCGSPKVRSERYPTGRSRPVGYCPRLCGLLGISGVVVM